MTHKKQNHPQSVSKCRDFLEGKCDFTANECWYNHEKRKPVSEPENRADESVFQKAPEKNHPPDMMKKLMDMMEVIMEKVNRLEKSVPPQQ